MSRGHLVKWLLVGGTFLDHASGTSLKFGCRRPVYTNCAQHAIDSSDKHEHRDVKATVRIHAAEFAAKSALTVSHSRTWAALI